MSLPSHIHLLHRFLNDSIQEQAETRAHELFDSGSICAESVLTAVMEACGVTDPAIPRIATGFGGGISRMGGTCGAVTGGVMALGMILGRDHPDESREFVYEAAQELQQQFIAAHGDLTCRALTGVDFLSETGSQEWVEKGMPQTCAGFCSEVVRTVIDQIRLLQEKE